MIGLKFLMTFVTVIIFIIVFAALLFALWFVVSWVIRLFLTGFGVTASEHLDWIKEHTPKRNKFCKGCYKIYSVDTLNLLMETDDPKVIQMCLKAPNQFIVVEPGKELRNV